MKKNNIKYLAYILLIQLMVVSCNDNESTIDFNYTGNISLDRSSISLFDDNYDLNITFDPTKVKPDVTLENVEILKGFPGGTTAGNANVSGNTATFSTAILKPFISNKSTGDMKIEAVATLSDGSKISRGFTISVTNAGTISIEDIKGETLSSIAFQSPDTVNVVMANISLSHSSATEMLEWKKNNAGTYAQEAFTFNNTQNDTLKLFGANSIFNKYSAVAGDTIYFRYILDNTISKDTLTSKIAIVSQFMGEAKSVVFADNGVTNINLSSGETNLTSGFEISYVNPTTLNGSSGIMFVKSTDNQLFDSGDLFKAKAQYDAGTPSANLTGIAYDDLYIYKIDRDGKTYYGLVKIGDLVNPGTNAERLNVQYKEGMFL